MRSRNSNEMSWWRSQNGHKRNITNTNAEIKKKMWYHYNAVIPVSFGWLKTILVLKKVTGWLLVGSYSTLNKQESMKAGSCLSKLSSYALEETEWLWSSHLPDRSITTSLSKFCFLNTGTSHTYMVTCSVLACKAELHACLVLLFSFGFWRLAWRPASHYYCYFKKIESPPC